MPSTIYQSLIQERIERPISKGRPMNLHKWTLAIRKRRQSGHRKALILNPKPKLKRTRKRAIIKATIANTCKECHGYGMVGRAIEYNGRVVALIDSECPKCTSTEGEGNE